jgi:hypothetical protein
MSGKPVKPVAGRPGGFRLLGSPRLVPGPVVREATASFGPQDGQP